MGIQDNIYLLGNRNDMPRLYQAMDILVLPSRYEGLPVVGVEAQAADLPCVLSDKITPDTKMTNSAAFLSIKQSAKTWAGKILSLREYKRKADCKELQEHGFDIEGQGIQMLMYYFSVFGDESDFK